MRSVDCYLIVAGFGEVSSLLFNSSWFGEVSLFVV